MRKKIMAGAAILALLMNSPQVKADDIVVFGGEFEDESTSAKKNVEKPAPVKEKPPKEISTKEKPAPVEKPKIEPQDKPSVQPFENEKNTPQPEIVEPQDELPIQPFENEKNTPQPEIVEPQDELPIQPLEEPEPIKPEIVEPQENFFAQPEDDDNWGDKLVFDDLNNLPEQTPQPIEKVPPQEIDAPTQPKPISVEPIQPIKETPPQEIVEPVEPDPINVEPIEYERPFEHPTEISNEWQERAKEPVVVVPPLPEPIKAEKPAIRPPQNVKPVQPQKPLKMLKPRFVKLAVDDTYVYYLDKTAVKWEKMPYSSSEYIADVWIRMVEREATPLDEDMAAYGADNFKAQIDLAREQGYQYPPEDILVLQQQNYILEHYYLRPKTRQVQFLCELEVFGRPQNTINERAYDYKNWENLVPGSVESTIYDATIKILGKSKGSEKGHMTFIDMLEEYGRISLR